MLSARFGLHTLEPYAPLGPYPSGFGAFGEEYQEGVCADGASYTCGLRNGVYSCRPCFTHVLLSFQELQKQINRVIVAKGLPSSLLLDVDGRIGSKTATSLGRALQAIGADVPSDLAEAATKAMNAPSSTGTYTAIARVAPGMGDYVRAQANAMNAPKTAPAAPAKPEPVATGPATSPGEEVLVPTPSAPKRSRLGYVVGGLAVLGAIGLVATAAYQKRVR